MTAPYSRILICGGRDYRDHIRMRDVMAQLRPQFAHRFCIIDGGANGADALAREWARLRGAPNITMFANWETYGKRAGGIRNRWMLEFAMPDLVIAFPGGEGTADMCQQTRLVRPILDLYVVDPHGKT